MRPKVTSQLPHSESVSRVSLGQLSMLSCFHLRNENNTWRKDSWNHEELHNFYRAWHGVNLQKCQHRILGSLSSHSTGMDTGGAHNLRNEWPGKVHQRVTSMQGQKACDVALWSVVSDADIPLCLCSMTAALSNTQMCGAEFQEKTTTIYCPAGHSLPNPLACVMKR